MPLARSLLRLLFPPLVASLVAIAGPTAAAELTADAPPVGPFHRLEVSGIGELVLVQGNDERVAVEASARTRARIRLKNTDGTLEIHIEDARSGWKLFGERAPGPRLTVYFRTIESIEIAGAVKVQARAIAAPELRIEAAGANELRVDALKVGRLHVEGAGALKAELAGEATEQHVELAGAGDYRAAKLKSQTATVSIGGASRVLVNAERMLSVDVSGAGVVEYLGNPKVTQDVSGAGRVRRRDVVSVDEPLTDAVPGRT